MLVAATEPAASDQNRPPLELLVRLTVSGAGGAGDTCNVIADDTLPAVSVCGAEANEIACGATSGISKTYASPAGIVFVKLVPVTVKGATAGRLVPTGCAAGRRIPV